MRVAEIFTAGSGRNDNDWDRHHGRDDRHRHGHWHRRWNWHRRCWENDRWEWDW